MRAILPSICYLFVLSLAIHFCQSTSGFVLLGVAPVLLLDRYVFGLLPWRKQSAPVWDLCRRAIYAVAGAAVAYVARLGLVPLGEAVLAGILLSMGMFFLESVLDFFVQAVKPLRERTEPQPATRRNLFLRDGLILLALIAIGVPLEPLHPLRTVPKHTPAVVGLTYEDVRFMTHDGLQLAGWLIPHAESRGNVIFCHGHGRNREQGTGLLQTLHGLGLNILAFDFRGHGQSAGHTATFGHREVRDVLAAAAFLKQRFPDRPVFLVGISYGAAVAVQALPQMPEVRGVWIEGCFCTLPPVVRMELSRFPGWSRGILLAAYESLAWLDCGFWGPEIRPVDRLSSLQVPILFCHGTADDLVPFAEGKRLYDAYAGPKESYWVPGGSHYTIRRYHKDEYLRRLRDFLQGLLESET